MLVLVYQVLAGRTPSVVNLIIELFVLVQQECSELHQIADLNVLSIKIAHLIVLVFVKDVKIHVLEHVVLMRCVVHKIINQFALALKVMKVTLMLVAIGVKVSLVMLMYVLMFGVSLKRITL